MAITPLPRPLSLPHRAAPMASNTTNTTNTNSSSSRRRASLCMPTLVTTKTTRPCCSIHRHVSRTASRSSSVTDASITTRSTLSSVSSATGRSTTRSHLPLPPGHSPKPTPHRRATRSPKAPSNPCQSPPHSGQPTRTTPGPGANSPSSHQTTTPSLLYRPLLHGNLPRPHPHQQLLPLLVGRPLTTRAGGLAATVVVDRVGRARAAI
mmetsp:Transcript_1445/g.3870  ORF Transcript_1445/g.3870 Transcript_1445/m.3870 type:complete len:208 (+) Transcript_1445:166-789(+)